MNNELTVIDNQSTDVMIPEPVSTGLELGGSYLKPDELGIVQGTSDDAIALGGRLGQVYIKGTDQFYSKLSLVPIRVTITRSLFPEGTSDFKGIKPVCRSFGGFKPADNVQTKMSEVCMKTGPNGNFVPVCKKAMWRQDQGGKKIAPPCRMAYRVLFHVGETGIPAFFNFKKTAEPVWNVTRDLLKKAIIAHHTRTKEKLDLYDFWFEFSAEKVPNKPYYIPRLKINRATDEQRKENKQLFLSYTARPEQADDEDAGVESEINGGSTTVEAEYVNEV